VKRAAIAMGFVGTALVAAAIGVAVVGGGEPEAAYAADPNAPAMIFADDRPCTAPCVKTGVVYGSASSRFRPDEGKLPLALDLFRSKKTPKSNAPTVVLAHGGGFVEGDRSQMRLMAEQFANAGFLAATIQYRLVPKDRNSGQGIVSNKDLVPASAEAEEDVVRALRYLRRNAKALGAARDQSRYAVGGFSAGAIASLRVAVRSGDKSTPQGRRFRVGAAFSIAGAECQASAVGTGCKPAYDEDDAPMLIFHGDADSVVQLTFARDTCTAAILRGGGCKAYFYPDQDHFWDAGTIYGGAKDLTKKQPAVVPTVVKYLRKEFE
jgi:dienelactone hydrolase